MRRALLLAVLVASGIGAGRAADPRTSLADDAGSIGAGRAVEEADLIYEDADDAFDEDYGQDDDDDYAYAGEYGSDGYFGFSEYDGDGSYDDDYGRERDDEAVTKLRHAIEEGNVDVVGSLLENGADLEKKICLPTDGCTNGKTIYLPSFVPIYSTPPSRPRGSSEGRRIAPGERRGHRGEGTENSGNATTLRCP
mmetsp:Transcript_7364/g.22622  ORF Transcript_7364/g.22622 Transcript_7364/m.22622 type:complete len:195 (-) Transcript_7364:1081-1665(-)